MSVHSTTLPALLDIDQVAAVVGLGRRTIQRMVSADTFPPPRRFTRQLVRWPACVVRDWLKAQGAEMPDDAPPAPARPARPPRPRGRRGPCRSLRRCPTT